MKIKKYQNSGKFWSDLGWTLLNSGGSPTSMTGGSDYVPLATESLKEGDIETAQDIQRNYDLKASAALASGAGVIGTVSGIATAGLIPTLITEGTGALGGWTAGKLGKIADDKLGTKWITPTSSILGGLLGGIGGNLLYYRSSPILLKEMLKQAKDTDWSTSEITIPDIGPKWKWTNSKNAHYDNGVVHTPLFARKSQLAHELGHYVSDEIVSDPNLIKGAYTPNYKYSKNAEFEQNAAENFADYFRTKLGYSYKGKDQNMLMRQKAIDENPTKIFFDVVRPDKRSNEIPFFDPEDVYTFFKIDVTPRIIDNYKTAVAKNRLWLKEIQEKIKNKIPLTDEELKYANWSDEQIKNFQPSEKEIAHLTDLFSNPEKIPIIDNVDFKQTFNTDDMLGLAKDGKVWLSDVLNGSRRKPTVVAHELHHVLRDKMDLQLLNKMHIRDVPVYPELDNAVNSNILSYLQYTPDELAVMRPLGFSEQYRFKSNPKYEIGAEYGTALRFDIFQQLKQKSGRIPTKTEIDNFINHHPFSYNNLRNKRAYGIEVGSMLDERYNNNNRRLPNVMRHTITKQLDAKKEQEYIDAIRKITSTVATGSPLILSIPQQKKETNN